MGKRNSAKQGKSGEHDDLRAQLLLRAIDALPFVSVHPEAGRCFWSVKPSGKYAADCEVGAHYAALAWAHKVRWGGILLADIAIDQVKKGDRSGIEVGYHRALEDLLGGRVDHDARKHAECFGAIGQGVQRIMGECAIEVEAALEKRVGQAIGLHIRHAAAHVERLVYDEGGEFTRWIAYTREPVSDAGFSECPHCKPLKERLSATTIDGGVR